MNAQKAQDTLEILAVIFNMIQAGLSDDEIKTQFETNMNVKMSTFWVSKIKEMRSFIQ